MIHLYSASTPFVSVSSCSSTQKTSHGSGNDNGKVISLADGLSYTTAVVIQEKTETKGVDAEYKWIKDHYSNYKIKGQALSTQGKKPFDIITITLSNGNEVKLYFDISNFFGKF